MHGMFCSLEVDISQRPRFSELLLKQMLLTVDTCSQVSDQSYSYSHWLSDSFACGRPLANEVKFPLSLVSGSLLLPTCHGPQLVSSSTQPQLYPSWVRQELLDYGSGRAGTDLFVHGVVQESVHLLTELQVPERQFGEHLRFPQFSLCSLCSLDNN